MKTIKTINIYFNSSERDFKKNCKKRGIHTKVVEHGSGCKHCTGPYTFRWIETDRPNYEMYIFYLDEFETIDIYFYTENDRTEFIEELAKKVQVEVVGLYHPDIYYKMKNLYGAKLRKKQP